MALCSRKAVPPLWGCLWQSTASLPRDLVQLSLTLVFREERVLGKVSA